MQRITFCNRCRGMKVGWNRRYIVHRLLCKQWLRNSSKLASVAILTAALPLAFPEPNASVFSADRSERPMQEPRFQATVMPLGPAVRSMDDFLKRHDVRETDRSPLAGSILPSPHKYD